MKCLHTKELGSAEADFELFMTFFFFEENLYPDWRNNFFSDVAISQYVKGFEVCFECRNVKESN